MKRLLFLLVGVVLVGGCDWFKPRERAPLMGGETLSYRFQIDGMSSFGTLSFERKDRGFILKSTSPGFEPQRLGPDLRDPMKFVEAYGVGVVWLPPTARGLGTKSFAGEVLRVETYDDVDLLVVLGPFGVIERFFDAATGFLVALRSVRPPEFRYAQLEETTVPGLEITVVPDLMKLDRRYKPTGYQVR